MELTRRETLGAIGVAAVAGCTTAGDESQSQTDYLVIESGETHAVSGEETYAGIEWQGGGSLLKDSTSELVLTE